MNSELVDTAGNVCVCVCCESVTWRLRGLLVVLNNHEVQRYSTSTTDRDQRHSGQRWDAINIQSWLSRSLSDMLNVTLAGLPTHQHRSLHSVLNAEARLIYRRRRFDHVTPVLRDVHWLKVLERVTYKLPWLSIGAYMAWHRRICATAYSVSPNWIGAGHFWINCRFYLCVKRHCSFICILRYKTPNFDWNLIMLTLCGYYLAHVICKVQ